MREFFHGWRRKAGCVTLVMALLAMAGWVRARYISDVVRLDLGRRQHRFFTHDDRIHWASYESQWRYWLLPIEWATSEPYDILIFFTLGENTPAKDYQYWEISYWSITIPPTILSAYLILWKPRKRSIAEFTISIAHEELRSH